MIICPKNKFIFFKPLKCAGTSIESALCKFTDDSALITASYGRGGLEEYPSRNNIYVDEFGNTMLRFHTHTWPELFFSKIANPGIYSDYKIISAVRNPWDSLVSYYWYQIYNEKNPAKRESHTIKDSDSSREIHRKFNHVCLTKGRYPVEIVSELGYLSGKMSIFEYMFESNSRFVHDSVESYVRYENLQKDFEKTCRLLSLGKTDLPNFKTGIRNKKFHYSDYYSDETRALVKNKFSRIIDNFNYKFETS